MKSVEQLVGASTLPEGHRILSFFKYVRRTWVDEDAMHPLHQVSCFQMKSASGVATLASLADPMHNSMLQSFARRPAIHVHRAASD